MIFTNYSLINRNITIIKRALVILFITLLISLQSTNAENEIVHYLLKEEIEEAFLNNSFDSFKQLKICTKKISINIESPINVYGFYDIDTFIHDFSQEFSQYQIKKREDLEWVSKQLEEHYAVQSLNLILKNKRSEKTFYFKLIFFLTKRIDYYDFFFFKVKKDERWEIYHIRGLKI